MARLDDRGGRDAAGRGPYHRPDAELTPLRELGDWTLGDGEPDIRGWEVQTVGGRAIGTVRDLLVDRKAREVASLDIDLDDGHTRARAPMRAVQIDRHARVVRMDSADLLSATGEPMAFRGDVERAPVDRPVADARPGADARPVGNVPPVADSRPLADRPADGTTERVQLADGTIEETVVERRPVVYEEVVVRRRVVDPATDEGPDGRDMK